MTQLNNRYNQSWKKLVEKSSNILFIFYSLKSPSGFALFLFASGDGVSILPWSTPNESKFMVYLIGVLFNDFLAVLWKYLVSNSSSNSGTNGACSFLAFAFSQSIPYKKLNSNAWNYSEKFVIFDIFKCYPKIWIHNKDFLKKIFSFLVY